MDDFTKTPAALKREKRYADIRALHHNEPDLSRNAIADRMGCSPGTVKKALDAEADEVLDDIACDIDGVLSSLAAERAESNGDAAEPEKPALELVPDADVEVIDLPDVIDAVPVDESDLSGIVIPTSAQEAEARLAELGPLATAVEWERAVIIYALTKPGRSGPSTSSGSFTRISFTKFAQKGIHGLRTHNSVSAYWHTWQRAVDAGIAPEVKLGDHVDLPEIAWSDYYPPQETDVAEVVTAAIGADPRAVATEAWAELKERREAEEERNQALRDAYHEDEIQDLIDQRGWTRQEAEAFVENEKRPLLVEANRKAKRAEIRTAVRLASKIEEIVNLLLDAATDDGELLGDTERTQLQDAHKVLLRAMSGIDALEVKAEEKVIELDGARG